MDLKVATDYSSPLFIAQVRILVKAREVVAGDLGFSSILLPVLENVLIGLKEKKKRHQAA